jgi:Zn-dependent protease/CBS domain-containing protein
VLGRIAGIELTMRFTWVPFAMLIAVSFATLIGNRFPFLGGWRYVAAFAFVVAFTLSILVHELAHALVARRFKIPVHEINLGLFAAGTHIEGERKSPFEEFAISVVGPLASVSVGLLALLGTRTLGDGVADVALYELAAANLLVGITNLLPGLPLDGGWVLRAVIWKLTGNPHTGTIGAAWAGRILALSVLAAPVVFSVVFERVPSVLDLLIAFAISWFLWVGSTQALIQGRVRRRLPVLNTRAMARRAIAVHASTPVSEAVRLAIAAQAGAVVVTDNDDKPIAIVSERAVASVDPGRRPWTTTGEVATSIRSGHVLGVDDTGEEVLAALRTAPAGEYLVLDTDGSVYGVLSTEDVERAFRSR